jgi:hypothetical protein
VPAGGLPHGRPSVPADPLPGTALSPAASPPVPDRRDTSPLSQVLERTAKYVRDYGEAMSLVVSAEHYSQWVESPGLHDRAPRVLESEYLIVRVDDDWLGFRDVHTVDGQEVAEHQDRLQKLFLSAPGTAVADARRIADESARFNVGAIQRNLNTPTMALYFLQAKNQPRFKFEKKGQDAIGGVAAWKVAFKETQRPTIVKTSSGKDMPVAGTAWIDPDTGRVLKTHMQIELEMRAGVTSNVVDDDAPRRGPIAADRIHSSASVTVSYRQDPRLGLLVPSEMLETYEGPRLNGMSNTTGTTKINCRATYSDFRRFQTTARFTIPK